MSTLVQFEPLVDSTVEAFLTQLSERYADKEDQSSAGVCDFGTWLQYFAFDVIGELTFSKRLGFIDRGIDVDNIIKNIDKVGKYVAPVRTPFPSPCPLAGISALTTMVCCRNRSGKSPFWTSSSSKTLYDSGAVNGD